MSLVTRGFATFADGHPVEGRPYACVTCGAEGRAAQVEECEYLDGVHRMVSYQRGRKPMPDAQAAIHPMRKRSCKC